MLVAVVVILFSGLNIRRMGRDMVTSNTINPVISDVVIALSLIGLVTSIIEIIGYLLQVIGLVEAETLTAIVTWLAVNCSSIVTILAGLILADHDYQLRSMLVDKFNKLKKMNSANTIKKKAQ